MTHQLIHLYSDDVLHITVPHVLTHPENMHIWEQMMALSCRHRANRILIECSSASSRIAMEHCFELIERIPLLYRPRRAL